MDSTPQTHVTMAVAALVAVAAAVTLGVLVSVAAAALVLGTLTVAAAILRVTLRGGTAFSVRRRTVDVAVMVAFAALLIYLGLTTPL